MKTLDTITGKLRDFLSSTSGILHVSTEGTTQWPIDRVLADNGVIVNTAGSDTITGTLPFCGFTTIKVQEAGNQTITWSLNGAVGQRPKFSFTAASGGTVNLLGTLEDGTTTLNLLVTDALTGTLQPATALVPGLYYVEV